MKILTEIFNDAWPLIAFLSEILIIFKLISLIKNKIKIDIFKEIMDFFFLCYIIILFYIVTYPDVYNYQISNLKPFREILRYPIDSKLFIQNVLGNLLLFIPYSFYMSFSLKINKLYLIIIFTFLLSLTIELIQIKIGRVFDVDDILLNTISGIIGYCIYKICNIKLKFYGER